MTPAPPAMTPPPPPPLPLHTHLFFLATLVAFVAAGPTRTVIAELSSTASASLPCATSALVSVVECMGIGTAPSPVPTHSAQVLIPDLGNATLQQADAALNATTSPAIVPIFMIMNDGGSLSLSVIGSIVGGFAIFVAALVALFCLWHKCCCNTRALGVPPSVPRGGGHILFTLSSPVNHHGQSRPDSSSSTLVPQPWTPTYPAASRARPSRPHASSLTLAPRASGSEHRGDDASVKDELEMTPVARLSPA
ncbi:hypothetical protein C8R44DRAFT_878230 [Mycena epipterygia]|nr:hypothetical protein C8R44DRAFT_878230 [Mycena epipterygia]